jgi:hypothetical protein
MALRLQDRGHVHPVPQDSGPLKKCAIVDHVQMNQHVLTIRYGLAVVTTPQGAVALGVRRAITHVTVIPPLLVHVLHVLQGT